MEKTEGIVKEAATVNNPAIISLCCREEVSAAFIAAWEEMAKEQKECQLVRGYCPNAHALICDSEGMEELAALPTEWNGSQLLFLLDTPDSCWIEKAQWVFQPPYGYEAILRYVQALLGKPVQGPSKSLIRRQAKACLESLCIPSRLLGHGYLTEGILLLFSEPHPGRPGLLQEIYRYAAQKYNSSPVMVDRAIRHGVEVCWKKGAPEKLRQLLGYDNRDLLGTPTNGEFLYALYQHLRLLLNPAGGETAFREQLRLIAQRHGVEE